MATPSPPAPRPPAPAADRLFVLRLSEDHLGAGQELSLAPANRILWAVAGQAAVANPTEATLDQTHAWRGAAGCRVSSAGGAHILRWELLTPGVTGPLHTPSGGARTDVKLEHAIALDPSAPYLMRCDRVDFAPGGEARPHGHRGGGIRRLLVGELEVRIGEGRGRVMKPGDAWFESGVEPVHALASAREPTSFIRVSILPRALRGQSSILYVNPADAAVKPRQYTVYVDEPIELAGAP